ncbi:MAG: hypothetical protein H8E71_00035 [Candidatus Marinimicrobia bacterium]|nr:hypothetical protein [Candidatus Neomarinimicrobiota bacterium]
MKKSRNETLAEFKKEFSIIENLYKAKCINWSGSTNDSDELYTEIISNEILRNLIEFDKIKTVTRSNTYCRENHKAIEIDLESNRKEEIFAKRIAYLDLGELGLIKDYQIPLKDTQADKGLGKIDLISFNSESKTLYLIELKYDGNKETLLRASLESYTYYKIINHKKLINDCLNNKQFILNKVFDSVNPDEINIKPAVLLTPNCNAFDEFYEMELGERPKLKSLSLALDINYFTLEIMVDGSIL